VMKAIAKEAVEDPDRLKSAPHDTPVRRLDEASANRKPVLAAPVLAAPGPASPGDQTAA